MVSTELLVLNVTLGLLSSFSPCLFPLLPSYLANQLRMKQSKIESVFSSLALIAGIIVVFFSIGFLSTYIGEFLINNRNTLARIQALIILIAALILLISPQFMYNIKLPEKLENFIYSDEGQKNSLMFSFILGLVYTIIAAPCAGALFISVWAGMIGQTIFTQFLLVLAFAFGAGIPFLAMSLFVEEIKGETIGKIHATSSWVSRILGIIFLITAVWLFYDTL
ncbi:MAG: cytochrome c biogenesis protein CcdA [Candidatus Heimdallarchaeota archaeon]|nr:cytochrome c biogenesis protein CcdA [Candidatus Heimdallarchaeota archaeon]